MCVCVSRLTSHGKAWEVGWEGGVEGLWFPLQSPPLGPFPSLLFTLASLPSLLSPLSFSQGKPTLMLGPPSSGKSSLLKMLCGRMVATNNVKVRERERECVCVCVCVC